MAAHTKLKLRDIFRAVLCTVFVGFPYMVVLFQTPGVFHMISHALGQSKLNQVLSAEEGLEARGNSSELAWLQASLERAATPDKTVIITTLNQAWANENSMLDLFLQSFQEGEGISHLVKHLLIVALDQFSYDRCTLIHEHCYFLRTKGVDFSGEKYFMTEDYLKMMWRRVDFLRTVLELGYNFLFTDADIMWFRDPFQRLNPDSDIQIACDKYLGRPDDLQNRPNGGFLYVRANERSVKFYKYWHSARLVYPQKHDQDVFNCIKGDQIFRNIGVKVSFLSTVYFGGFCQASKDFGKVCTMHANCCIGLESKLADLRLVMEDWKTFRDMSPLQRRMQTVRWKAPVSCARPR